MGIAAMAVLGACSRQTPEDARAVMSLEAARAVVTLADSLRAAGCLYDDSVQLAQAYRTLERQSVWRLPVTAHETRIIDDYAHACYHYGRLLRAKDNPVAAMQCFIAATRSRTRDYHILGRVYSNMGSIAHLAGEYALSYDMYDRSAASFLKNGDTILYYYGLNNMAFEMAIAGNRDKTLALAYIIEDACNSDSGLQSRLNETKAELALYTQHYDSALFYADATKEPSRFLIKAQVFSVLSMKDSATYYAEQVTHHSKSLADLNNALFILTNDDETKEKAAIRETASERADIQKLLEIRRGKISQAVQLLQQDLERKPDWRWLYAIIVTIVIIGTGIYIYVFRKRKKHGLLAQKVEALQQAASAMQEKQEELNTRYQTNHQRVEEDINHRCLLLKNKRQLNTVLEWNDFTKMCNIVDNDFYLLASKLQQTHVLNETEIRLCVLVLIGLSRIDIANTLPYAINSVGKLKDQTAKKLGTTGKNLREYLLYLAIEG